MRTTLTLVAVIASAQAAAAQEALTVYAYDSFVSEWGPGPLIETGFEAECGCDLRLIAAGDGAAMLSRLMLEGAATEADVVVGLDNFLMERARGSGLFAPHGLGEIAADLPVAFADDIFVPFDWGAFAFVGTAGAPAPDSLRALADSDLAVVIQDPRSSTPGLGLALWVKAAYGDDAAALWADLADNIVTVTPGWTEAYNLFLEGEADAVLSYTTSPAYHAIAEGDAGKVAWPFAEGHLIQIEVAAAVAGSDAPDLAGAFLRYLAGPDGQAPIPETNWMFPALMPEGGLDPAFDAGLPAATLPLSPEDAAALRDAAVADWQAGLAQ